MHSVTDTLALAAAMTMLPLKLPYVGNTRSVTELGGGAPVLSARKYSEPAGVRGSSEIYISSCACMHPMGIGGLHATDIPLGT